MGMQRFRGDLIVVGAGLLGTWLTFWGQRRGLKVFALDAGLPATPEPQRFHLHQLRPWRRQLFFDGLGCWCEELGAEWAPLSSPRLDMQWEEGPDFEQLSHDLETRKFLHQRFDRGQASRLHPAVKPGPERCIFSNTGSVELRFGPWLSYRWNHSGAVAAETPVLQVDLEHETPTAVTRDAIYRGDYLVVAAGQATGKLAGQEIPCGELSLLNHVFLEEELPDCGLWWGEKPLAHALNRVPELVLEAAHPEALDRFKSRLRLEGDFSRRERVLTRTLDGAPVAGPLPWRSDLWTLTGLGDNEAVMAPSLSREILERILQQRPTLEDWAPDRFEADE